MILAAVPASASAADAPVFAVKPVGQSALGWFRFDAAPGATIAGRVRVVNAGNAAGTAELAAVDATTGATTGAVYETVGSAGEDVGAWLTLDAGQVTLGPGESTVVGFSLRVPADGRRGDHLGGIVVRPLAAPDAAGAKSNEKFRVNVVDQAIVGVEVGLPGAARQVLAVRDVKASGNPGYQTLLVALSNPGERMVKGQGTVVVTDGEGQEVQRQDFAIDTFLPRTRIDFPLVLRKAALVPGDYHAQVNLRWDGGHRSTTELPFAVSRKNIEQAYGSEGLAKLPGADRAGDGGGLPVALIGGGVVLLLLLIGGLGWSFRRRTRELERRLAAAIAPPEGDGAEIRVGDARDRSPTLR